MLTIPADSITYVTVSICLLMAVGSVPIAARETRPRASVAFGVAFTLLACGWACNLLRLNDPDPSMTLIFIQNAFWCTGALALWGGISLRAGHPVRYRLLVVLGAIWLLPNLVFGFVAPDPTLRLLAAGVSVLGGLGFSAWQVLNKASPRNMGDLLLTVWFMLVIAVMLAAMGMALAGQSSERIIVYYVAAMPMLFAGLGLFLFQSFALDAIDEMQRQARTDTMTGLMNRRAFDEELTQALARASRYGRSLSLVMTDIDHFKRINDEHGHPFGDRVIRDFARMLKEESREVDTVARIGGEEFAVVLPEIDLAQASQFAERLRQAAASLAVRGVQMTASFGVSDTTVSEYSGSALIQDADGALYRAKQNGRNRVELAGEPAAALATS
jgi:diguanylate cyclase (GGDEF)-like protein